MKTQFYFLLFAACLFSMASCNQTYPTNTDLVKLRFEAMNKHDLSAIEALYSDSALIESPNLSAPEKGKKGIHSVYSRYFKSSPDDGHAYMLDKKYSLQNCTILEIRNHKIVRDASYFDQVSFLRQVGFFEQH